MPIWYAADVINANEKYTKYAIRGFDGIKLLENNEIGLFNSRRDL